MTDSGRCPGTLPALRALLALSALLELSACLTALSAGAAEPPATAAWLVVAASDASAAGIAQRARALALPGQLVVQTRDCGAARNVFAVAAAVADSAAAAEVALSSARAKSKDAYVKRCNVVARSLLALRVPAVDPSIAGVPDDAVNWDESDRVSSSVALADGSTLVVVRYFTPGDDNDPLEGRRQRILWVRGAVQRALADDCPSAGGFSGRGGNVAFHCGREQAGDHELHATLVFSASGDKLTEIARCRAPRWLADGSLSCEAESVDAQGRLKLHAKKTAATCLKPGGCPPHP